MVYLLIDRGSILVSKAVSGETHQGRIVFRSHFAELNKYSKSSYVLEWGWYLFIFLFIFTQKTRIFRRRSQQWKSTVAISMLLQYRFPLKRHHALPMQGKVTMSLQRALLWSLHLILSTLSPSSIAALLKSAVLMTQRSGDVSPLVMWA